MTGVEYNVNLSLTGAGAEQAVAQLRMLQAEFGRTATAGAAVGTGAVKTTTAVGAFSGGTRALRSEIKAMSGALTLVGMTQFPQLTMSAMIAQQAMRGLKIAVAETGVALKVLAPLTIAAGAALYKLWEFGKANWDMWKQVGASNETEANAIAQAADSMAKMYQRAIEAVTEGRLKLSDSEADWLASLVKSPTPERSKLLHDFLKDRLPAGTWMSESDRAKKVSAELERTANVDRYIRAQNPGESPRDQLNNTFNLTEQKLKDLQTQGYLTTQQFADMWMAAKTEHLEGLNNLKSELTDLQELGRGVGMEFAGGFSQAIVNSFKEGGKAMKEFASQFVSLVAQMVLQAAILRALNFVSPTLFPIGKAAGGFAFSNPQFAANGLAGVSSVSRATYFPRFNVVAGEAGREMLTVLARPRMMQIGGMEAVVGNAGNNRLAITNANQLAAGGAGGHVLIEVRHSPETQASIISSSVERAVVRVTQDANRPTALRQAIKRA